MIILCRHIPKSSCNLYLVSKISVLEIGDYWRLLEITGDYWRLLEITGDYWGLLEITGDYRMYFMPTV